jgi:hypothetical protein
VFVLSGIALEMTSFVVDRFCVYHGVRLPEYTVGVGIGVEVGGGKVGRSVGMGIWVTDGAGVLVGKPDDVIQQTMLWSIPQFPPIVHTWDPEHVRGSELGAHII